MSSEVDSIGMVATAVALPAAAAFGAGWLAWQSGKLLVEANRAVDRQIAEKKRQIEEAARNRRRMAIAAHAQMVDMCKQILVQLEAKTFDVPDFTEIEQLKYDLKEICEEKIPDDVGKLEGMVSVGYLMLDRLVQKQNRIAELQLEETESGLYCGLSVADLMDDLRIVVSAIEIQATNGADVKAADPVVLERAKLNERFVSVSDKVIEALEYVNEIHNKYGLTESGDAWFQSCFIGVDELVARLCRPTTDNRTFKKGILRLEEAIERFELMAPSIENESRKRRTLYEVYVDASKALGERVEEISSFKSIEILEEKLEYLRERSQRAKECAEIYEKLGLEAYLCYAWDQELNGIGYEVHSRKKVQEMAENKPQYAQMGEVKLPFYQWNHEDMTQLYSITSGCSLQVVVHRDGVVSMRAIAEANGDSVINVQKEHCSKMSVIRERLRKNWFILYDFDESQSPEVVTDVESWRNSEDYAWKENGEKLITEQREREGRTSSVKYMR